MSLRARRVIFYFLLLIFLILAPLILIYTAGYRWSFTRHRLVQTGALSITTVPDGATVILNRDRARVFKTPALIRELTPGNYEIQIEREGYLSWEKTLPVEDEKTTFAHSVALFKAATPQSYAAQSAAPLISSADTGLQSFKDYMVYADARRNRIVVVDNHTHERIGEFNAGHAVWNKGNEPSLFVYSSHEVWEFHPRDRTATLITRLIEDIQQVIPLPDRPAVLLILRDRIRALELDLRDRQNAWDLANFDQIKTASLAENGKMLVIQGGYKGKEGMWELELY